MIEHWLMKEFPALFVGGGLSQSRRARFAYHLNRCSRCSEEVRKLTRLTGCLKGDPVPPVSPETWREFSGRLHRALEAEKEKENSRKRSFPALSFSAPRSAWVLPAGVAAVLIVLFSAALMIKDTIPPGAVSDQASVDEDTLVAELAGVENDILEEEIGKVSPVPDSWMGLLADAGDADIEEINLSLNGVEEEIWDDPELLEEVIKEVLS